MWIFAFQIFKGRRLYRGTMRVTIEDFSAPDDDLRAGATMSRPDEAIDRMQCHRIAPRELRERQVCSQYSEPNSPIAWPILELPFSSKFAKSPNTDARNLLDETFFWTPRREGFTPSLISEKLSPITWQSYGEGVD